MMWANLRQKIVYAGCSAPAFLGQSLRGSQPNFPPFSRSYYRGQALLFGEGSNTMLNVGSYVYRGFPFSTKPLREFTSSNIKSYCSCDRSRPFSSFSGDVVQSKPGNAKGEILHQPDERRVPMARSMWKGPFVDAFLLRMKTRKESIANKKIWSRRSVILPEFVNCSVRIYTGKTFVRRKITEGMVGHKFGEFALTRKRKLLRKNAELSKKKGKR